MEKAIALHKHFLGRCLTTMGIGTHFSNDVGYTPPNHVIKLASLDIGDGGVDLIKLGDGEGKFTGKEKVIAQALELLKIK